MSSENIEVFQGGTFVFGVEGQRFEVYKVLVSRKSNDLEAMMSNGMKETHTGVASLQDTSAPTFARFQEWLMTGDYNPASSKPPAKPGHSTNMESAKEFEILDIVDKEDIVVPSTSFPSEIDFGFGQEPYPLPEGDFWAPVRPTKISKKARHLRARPRSIETTVRFPSVTTQVNITPAIPTDSMFVSIDTWDLDYLPLFLSHAQLYAFADVYGISDLRELTARRLEEALGSFVFASPCHTDFATLLEYVYSHTADREGKTDVLRAIATNFAANNMKVLSQSERFQEMIENGGAVVKDLFLKTFSS